MIGPDPNYDLKGALEAAELGYTIQHEQLDAAYAQYVANGFKPLSPTQIAAVLLAGAETVETNFDEDVLGVVIPPNAIPYPDSLPPVFPTLLPRFPDSNEEPFDNWTPYGPQQQRGDFW